MTPLEASGMMSAAIEALSAGVDDDDKLPTSKDIFDWIHEKHPDLYAGFLDGCLHALLHYNMALAGASSEP